LPHAARRRRAHKAQRTPPPASVTFGSGLWAHVDQLRPTLQRRSQTTQTRGCGPAAALSSPNKHATHQHAASDKAVSHSTQRLLAGDLWQCTHGAVGRSRDRKPPVASCAEESRRNASASLSVRPRSKSRKEPICPTSCIHWPHPPRPAQSQLPPHARTRLSDAGRCVVRLATRRIRQHAGYSLLAAPLPELASGSTAADSGQRVAVRGVEARTPAAGRLQRGPPQTPMRHCLS